MKVLLTTCNAKYIHKNLALRWLYTTCPHKEDVLLKEFTIKDHVEHIAAFILEQNIDILCFSCYIWNIDLFKTLCSYLKERKPSLHVIVGGPEVSYESYELIEQGVDAISIGEGEQSIWEYVQTLEMNESRCIKGMYTAKYPDTTYRKSDLFWLETFENPYFFAFDNADMDKRYFYLETSRGCPYGCTYCLSSTDTTIRMFSMKYILNILEKLKDSDVKQVKLLDRTFNAHPKRALQIARYMNDYCENQIFQFEIVAETLSEELLTFFCEEAKPGRFRFEIGVQSFHSKTLRAVGRLQDNERLQTVITRLKQAGCIMHVDLIAGLPYEDLDSFHASYDALFALQASELQLGILKLLKGTRLRAEQHHYQMTFSANAPYDIISNKWLSENALLAIHQCADATEKCWNSGMLRYTIQTILQLKWYTSPFTLFMKLGIEYAKLPRPYQPYQLFECVKAVANDQDEHEVDALLMMDYYAISKQRPKRFTKSYVTLLQKKALMNLCLEAGIANQDQLFRYGVIDIGYHQYKICYQLILYNNNQTHPTQYIIDTKHQTIKEWIR